MINEWIQNSKKGSILSDKESEIQKALVSSRLMYKFVSLYKGQIDPEEV